MHAQVVKQSVYLSSVIIVVTKIATSRVLCIWACCNYHKLVDKVKSWFLCTSNCWTSLTSTTNCAFFVQHACGLPTTPTPCADLTLDCACSTSMQRSPNHEVYTAMYTALRGMLQSKYECASAGIFKGACPVDRSSTLHVAALWSARNGAQCLTESLRIECSKFQLNRKAEALSLS